MDMASTGKPSATQHLFSLLTFKWPEHASLRGGWGGVALFGQPAD